MNTGYEFVRLPDRVERRVREEACHDRRVANTWSGKLTLTFRTEQPIHVGVGYKALIGEAVVRAGVRVLERPGLPGSSLKGVIRGRYEAITYSCTSVNSREMAVRSSSFPGVKRGQFTQEVLRQAVFQTCESKSGLLCPACALFGLMSRRSRVTFTDFVTPEGTGFEIKDMREQFSPNIHHVAPPEGFQVQGAKFEVRAVQGRKFGLGMCEPPPNPKFQKVETIPVGVRLTGELRVLNLTLSELGGLLAAIGGLPAGAIKVGGGKGIGFGRIKLIEVADDLRDARGRPLKEAPPAWGEAFRTSPDYWATGAGDLQRIHQGGC